MTVGLPESSTTGSKAASTVQGRSSKAADVVHGGDGNDTLVGNFGSDVLLGGKGDDAFLGDNPNGEPDTAGSRDVCNGQQGTDFAVEETCEQENQIEVTGPFPEG